MIDPELQNRLELINSNTSWSSISPSFTKTSGTVQCPFCLRRGKGYLYPNFFKCFSSRCCKKGDKVNVYKQLHQLSFWQAVKDLEASSGLDPKSQSKEFDKRNEILSEVLYIYHSILLEDEQAMQYLINRGFTEEYIKRKQIGYAPIGRKTLSLYPHLKENQLILQELVNNYGDFFHQRIIFPIYNQNGYLVHLTGRHFPGENNDFKYLDSKAVRVIGSSKQYLLFEEELDRYLELGDTVYLTEGVMDSFILNKLGMPVLGLLGLQKIMNHVHKFSMFKRVIAVFDNDKYSLDHPMFPGEYKSWRQVNSQLIDLQTYLGRETQLFTCMMPEEIEGVATKDINDVYNVVGSSNLKEVLLKNEKDLTLSFIEEYKGDLSMHEMAIKLISSTGRGMQELKKYIAEDFDPLDYAIKVLSS